jgi:hypothetical protein
MEKPHLLHRVTTVYARKNGIAAMNQVFSE